MSSVIEAIKVKAKLLQKAKLKVGKQFKLKDALALLAKAAGYGSWREFKNSIEETQDFNPPGWSANWKTWYASYEKARAHLDKSGGFLLPYRNQYFICDIHYIEALGVSSDDPDLRAVGEDWAKPLDFVAWKRLKQKIRTLAVKR